MILFIALKFGVTTNGKGKTWTEFRKLGWKRAWTTKESLLRTVRRSTPTSSNTSLHFLEGQMQAKERLRRPTTSMTPEGWLPPRRRKMANAGTIIAFGTRDHYQTNGKRGDAVFATSGSNARMIVLIAIDATQMSSGIA